MKNSDAPFWMMTGFSFAVLLVLAMAAFVSKAQGQELTERTVKTSSFSLLKLDYTGVEYHQIRNYRDAYFPEYETVEGECTGVNDDGTKSLECYKYGASVMFDLNLVEIKDWVKLFWRNDVGMDATNYQVRRVGWNWRAGLDFGRVEVRTDHFSSHYLDGRSDYRFKLYDAYVIQLDVYGKRQQ